MAPVRRSRAIHRWRLLWGRSPASGLLPALAACIIAASIRCASFSFASLSSPSSFRRPEVWFQGGSRKQPLVASAGCIAGANQAVDQRLDSSRRAITDADGIIYASFKDGAVNVTRKADNAPITRRSRTNKSAEDTELYVGAIKSYSEQNSFGFIESKDAFVRYKSDIFVHKNKMHPNLTKKVGTRVCFRVVLAKNKAQARNVTLQEFPEPSKIYTGRIKRYSTRQGYGFIECQETFEAFSNDIFLHKNQVGDLQVGDVVNFTVEVSQRGQAQARNVQSASEGGSRFDENDNLPQGSFFSTAEMDTDPGSFFSTAEMDDDAGSFFSTAEMDDDAAFASSGDMDDGVVMVVEAAPPSPLPPAAASSEEPLVVEAAPPSPLPPPAVASSSSSEAAPPAEEPLVVEASSPSPLPPAAVASSSSSEAVASSSSSEAAPPAEDAAARNKV